MLCSANIFVMRQGFSVLCFRFVVLFCIPFLLSSCASIAGIFNTPTYSTHSTEKIVLEQSMNNIKAFYNNVYVKSGGYDSYSIQNNVIADVKKKLKKKGVNITDNIDEANYIVSVNIRNVVVDLDEKYTERLRKALVFQDTSPTYNFDGNNNPHLLLNKMEKIGDRDNNGFSGLKGRNMAPAVLYTLIGAGAGFTAGYFIGASISPIGIGMAGAFLLGGTTYWLYSSFKREGIIVIYDLVINEKTNKNVKYNKKMLNKTSGNSVEEAYYSYNSNWLTYTSKNAVISLGSRALRERMMKRICPIIADNVVGIFE